jgi:hypothetical protein
MVELGVTPKQADRARQSFDRSASAAGFYEQGKDRLVMPAGVSAPAIETGKADAETGYEGGSRSGGTPGRGSSTGGPGAELDEQPQHPFIKGLLTSLPAHGEEWPAIDRAKWLQTAASIFTLIYKGDGTVRVELEK